jgi:hypothetical protein
MVSEETVWAEIWPTVEKLIEGTLDEDDPSVAALLVPGGEAAALHDLFGYVVFDILLKTVLGRDQLAVTRAIQTERGRYVYIEFVWPDPDAADGAYTAADLVTVQLQRHQGIWRIVSVNPAAANLPLTEARARGVLATSGDPDGQLPQEPWILPVSLLAGNLQLPLRDGAVEDAVEERLLPGLQARNYGVLSLLAGRRLWRDFKAEATPEPGQPAAWAAAVEFILSEQNLRETTQAAVGKQYAVSLTALLPRIRQIKESLGVQGVDERYSALRRTQIVLKDDDANAS